MGEAQVWTEAYTGYQEAPPPRPSRASLGVFPQRSLDFGQDVCFRAIFLPKRQASVP